MLTSQLHVVLYQSLIFSHKVGRRRSSSLSLQRHQAFMITVTGKKCI